MKKILLFIVCISALAAGAQQNDSVPVRSIRLDSTTAIGKSDGNEVMQEIGREGGKIVSEDGRIELIFPDGALTRKKKITIQPVTNQAANGRGKAYRMEPSGLQFNKPATLVFHYSEDETTGTLPELKGIAGQDEKGKWEALTDVATDTVTKTIKSQIYHFSSYSLFDKLVLKPGQARVKVEKSIQLEIYFTISDPEAGIVLPPNIPAPEWSVNGIPNGNSYEGRITPLTTNKAKFTAPVSMPDDNPVAVAAQLKGMEFTFNKKIFKDPTLVSHLLIYDKAYRITMDFWVDNSEDGACTMRMEDYGAFTLVMEGTRTMIKEIENRNLRIRLNPCPCRFVWMNEPLVRGSINIAGASRIVVKAASLPDNPFARVSIMLKHTPSPFPDLISTCPSGGVPPGAMLGSMSILPPLIEFEANNEDEQLITLAELTHNSIKNGRRQGMRIVIKRIDEE